MLKVMLVEDNALLRTSLAEALGTRDIEVVAACATASEAVEELRARGVDDQRAVVPLLFLKARERAPVDSLSTREYLVAKLLASGLTQKEVAAKLERSPETIRSQAKVIFNQLGIGSATLLPGHLALRD